MTNQMFLLRQNIQTSSFNRKWNHLNICNEVCRKQTGIEEKLASPSIQLTNTFHVMSSSLSESFLLSSSLSCFFSNFDFLWVRIQTKMKPMIPGMKMSVLYTALFTALSTPVSSSFWTFLWRREEFDFPRKEFGGSNLLRNVSIQ